MDIYFDNSATTPICEAALARYCEVSRLAFGNPSSLHARGKEAEDILKAARRTVCEAIGARGGSVIFTASGTEANNLALFGRAHAKARYRRGRILVSAGEHASVKEPLRALADEGYTVEEIPTRGGVLDMDALAALLTPDTFLVSVMAVNNESGAAYDLAPLAALLRTRCPDCALHVDATQAFMKIPLDVRTLGIRMLTLSSHKIEGPKGVGALWIDDTLKKEKGVAPQILGGGQEDGMRSGTENVPGIAAFAAAVQYGKENFAEFAESTRALRAYLLDRLQSDPAFAEVRAITPPVCAPHILTLILPAIKSEVMLHHLSGDGISVSSGSACSSHGHTGTTALSAYGYSEKETDSAIRISLSHRNTREEVEIFLASFAAGLARLARKR